MLASLNTQELSNTAIIALTLMASERVIERLSEAEPMYFLAQRVIEAGWNWMNSRKPNPEEMYWEYNPVLMEMDSNPEYVALYSQKSYIKYAFHSLIYNHYIVICYSEATERLENPEKEYSVGNDIAEVNDEYITLCLDNCIKASQVPDDTETWLTKIISKLLREHSITSKGYSGESISKDFFKDI